MTCATCDKMRSWYRGHQDLNCPDCGGGIPGGHLPGPSEATLAAIKRQEEMQALLNEGKVTPIGISASRSLSDRHR